MFCFWKRQRGFSRCLCWSGWLLALVLACGILPRAYWHFYFRLPAVQRETLNRLMSAKKADFARPWQDERPLIILAGDSHIEMGDWYSIFGGALAVRNCGLSSAKIEDVRSLVSAIGDRDPAAVVLMCGFNNLAHNDSVESSINDYQELLSTIQTTIRPGKIVILSVMPLQTSAVDQPRHAINRKIADFDRQLEKLCGEHNALFVNVNPVLVDAAGSLLPNLTIDGLHLNRDGYDRVAAALLPFLITGKSSTKHASP